MHHYLAKTAVLVSLVVLCGCQTTSTTNNPVANVFSFAPPPAELNLAQSVQETLMLSDDPVIAQVKVQTIQNTVILSGYVKKIRQSDIAEQITRKVPGVQNVDNRIIVRP